jgi:predicted nucleic acid-binding protein
MRLYLDTCTLQRPLDDRSHLRIALEAEAVLAILALCEQQTLTLVVSTVIAFETSRNPHPQRQTFAQAIIAQAPEYITLTQTIEHRATTLEQLGVKAVDALHWATAEAADVNYFCTCDDRFYRKIKTLPALTLRMVTPLELAQEVVR